MGKNGKNITQTKYAKLDTHLFKEGFNYKSISKILWFWIKKKKNLDLNLVNDPTGSAYVTL